MVTTLELKALKADDAGKKINLGESMTGMVRAAQDGTVSVHVSWRYRFQGKLREVRLGTWRDKGGMSLKALRDERDRLAQMLKEGQDPIEAKAADRAKAAADVAQAIATERQRQLAIEQEQRERETAAREAALVASRRMTLRQLFDRWCSTELQPVMRADGKRTGRKDAGAYVRAQFERHVFPALGNVAVGDLRKADLLALIDAQKAKGQLRTAAVLLSDLRQMMAFALDRELIDADPLATVKKARIVGVAVERDRVLSPEEVTALATALPAARMSPRSEAAIWLLLATGARVGELMGAVWADALPADPMASKAHMAELQALADEDGAKVGIVNLDART